MPVLSDLPADILLELTVQLLAVRDVASLISTNSYFHNFSKGNHFWEELVRRRIAPTQCPGGNPSRWAANAKRVLGFLDYQHMFRAFHLFSCPLEGLWVLVGSATGGVCRAALSVSEPGGYAFVCVHGEGGEGGLWHSDSGWQLRRADSGDPGVSIRVVGDTMFTLSGCGEILNKYTALPAPVVAPASLAHLHSAVGLFTACYGPHGPEVVCTSLEPLQPFARTPDAEILELCGPTVLYGLKLTGDPNVPARELTFIVNAADRVSVATAMQAVGLDTMLMFYSIDRVLSQTTLRDRLPGIVMCLNGKAQVNILPGMWNPEWVDITYIVYNSTEANRISFSVLFQDMRYMMDFMPGICRNSSGS